MTKMPDNMREGRFLVSIIIIGGAFVLIGSMLAIQAYTASQILEKGTISADLKELNQSNQTVFNILIPVFGAWVGAVVAFYFGSKNLQQAQDVLQSVVSPEEKLAKKTASDLLTETPGARTVATAKMNETVEEITKKMGPYHNVVISDSDEKPLGILYHWDISGEAKDAKLNDVVQGITDTLTKQKWSKDLGVRNFAKIYKDDTLLEVRAKLEAVSDDDTTAVRGLVFDEKDNIIGIINYIMIAEYIR